MRVTMPTPPSTGPVTSPYGPRDLNVPGVGPFHYGEDRYGDGNCFPESGTIVFALYSGVFGNIIGVRAGIVVWNLAHHAHLNGRARGQTGAERDFLAPQGATGLVTGRHVHTERRVGGGDSIQSGTHTNPADYYTSTAGGGTTPLPTTSRRKPMSAIIRARDSGGHIFHFAPGFVKHLGTMEEVQALKWAETFDGVAPNTGDFDDGDFQRAIWAYGLDEYSMAQVLALAQVPGGKLWATTSTGALTDAQVAKIAAAIPQVDVASLAAAVADILRPGLAAIQANIDDSPADALANKIQS